MARHAARRILIQLLPMAVIGLTASLGLFVIVLTEERGDSSVRFKQLAEQRILAIRANIAIAQDSVALLGAHFAVAGQAGTSRTDFAILTEAPLSRHGFIQGFSWNPRIVPAERPALEEQARRDGLSGFTITEKGADGDIRPAGDRAEYVPIYYMEPIVANAAALGFDLASHPIRRQALDEARDRGRPQATGRITLVQERADQYGVLILAPVFGLHGPQNRDANRRALTGYVSGVFRIGDLIDASARQSPSTAAPMVNIHLFDMDGTASGQRLFPKGDDRDADVLIQDRHVAETISVAGRQWRLIATPSRTFSEVNRPIAAYITLVVSLAATLFSLFYLRDRIARADRTSRFAHDMAEARRRLAAAQSLARLSSLEIDPRAERFEAGEDAAAMLELPPGTTAGTFDALLAHVHAEDLDYARRALRSAVSGCLDREFRVLSRSGPRWLHALADGTVENGRVLITLQDITTRKAADAERAAMMARIAEADRFEALGTLAGGIAHEINTPTQYVSDNIIFMRDTIDSLLDLAATIRNAGIDPGACAEAATRAQSLDIAFLAVELPAAAAQALDGTARIAKIVQAIKEFSYPASTTPRPVDLNHLIDVVATVTRNQWKYVAEMTFDLDPSLPKISAVEGEINQVLINLMVNAAQAIGEKGEAARGIIAVTTRARGDQVELTVTDNGVGIPPDSLRRVFEMFFTTRPPGQGTGQGLAITRAIVHRHGGRITVDSPPGQGACFTVTLPVTSAPAGEGS